MITEVFKYRSYIQGLITKNLDIMTSKKDRRKVHIKSSPEDRQTHLVVQEKYPRSDFAQGNLSRTPRETNRNQ